jgi:hypothetical protein
MGKGQLQLAELALCRQDPTGDRNIDALRNLNGIFAYA